MPPLFEMVAMVAVLTHCIGSSLMLLVAVVPVVPLMTLIVLLMPLGDASS